MGLLSKLKGFITRVGRRLSSTKTGLVIAVPVEEVYDAVPYPGQKVCLASDECTEVLPDHRVAGHGVSDGSDAGNAHYAQPVHSESDTLEEGLCAHPVYKSRIVSCSPLCSSDALCLLVARLGVSSVIENDVASLHGEGAVNGCHVALGGAGVGRIPGRINRIHVRIGYGGPATPGGGWPPDCFVH